MPNATATTRVVPARVSAYHPASTMTASSANTATSGPTESSASTMVAITTTTTSAIDRIAARRRATDGRLTAVVMKILVSLGPVVVSTTGIRFARRACVVPRAGHVRPPARRRLSSVPRDRVAGDDPHRHSTTRGCLSRVRPITLGSTKFSSTRFAASTHHSHDGRFGETGVAQGDEHRQPATEERADEGDVAADEILTLRRDAPINPLPPPCVPSRGPVNLFGGGAAGGEL